MASGSDWKKITDEKKKYAAYLCSRDWGVLKEAVRERSGGICERCCVLPQDACHHLTYDRKYKEQLEDLQAICTPCHEFTHAKSAFDPEANSSFISWLSLSFNESVPWLDFTWPTSWLGLVFDYPTLAPVLQMWVSLSFVQLGVSDTLLTYGRATTDDGTRIEDIEGLPPSSCEMFYFNNLKGPELSFWSWLQWHGPAQTPANDKAAFDRCKELADTIRKSKSA